MADHMAVLNMPMDALKRSHTATSFEPFTLLSALSQATERIGLVATGSTTFDAPYHIARRFASLDWISDGRAGWNIVTTSNPDAALNFGLDEHMEHGERYRRAREFYDVVTGLWDSWADDAFVRDVEDGIFFDPAKMHVLDHKGKYLSVRGPLNIARPIQGWPVIVQAGASESGRQLAAETAEAVFTAQSDLAVGQKFYADVKGRMEKLGRAREHMKILPACFVVVGDTVEEAKAKRAKLDSLVDYANAIASLSIALGHDASKFDPDKPLPDNIPESNASKSGRERAIALGKRENLTVRQLAQRLGGYSGLAMVGTPQTHRRRDGGMARNRRLRRLYRDVSLSAGRARRFCRSRRAGIAAPRPVPPRLRRHDAARASRPAAAEEPIFRELKISYFGSLVSARAQSCSPRVRQAGATPRPCSTTCPFPADVAIAGRDECTLQRNADTAQPSPCAASSLSGGEQRKLPICSLKRMNLNGNFA